MIGVTSRTEGRVQGRSGFLASSDSYIKPVLLLCDRVPAASHFSHRFLICEAEVGVYLFLSTLLVIIVICLSKLVLINKDKFLGECILTTKKGDFLTDKRIVDKHKLQLFQLFVFSTMVHKNGYLHKKKHNFW